jgi:hypothetical protein
MKGRNKMDFEQACKIVEDWKPPKDNGDCRNCGEPYELCECGYYVGSNPPLDEVQEAIKVIRDNRTILW